ncbi:hypothetical protein [Helicobacter mastomyrinus]|uniref:Uncharacterized protein n=1 Tax=Helicobacter mastomyrinus TaxID=287948 RepID=A0ABZ3F4B4_9HELI|nr:hypothetical protein [uncultured Helicobacter sp.]
MANILYSLIASKPMPESQVPEQIINYEINDINGWLSPRSYESTM